MNPMVHAKGVRRRPVWERMNPAFCGMNRILLGEIVCGVKTGRMNPTPTIFFR
jgi:hypothetical protein